MTPTPTPKKREKARQAAPKPERRHPQDQAGEAQTLPRKGEKQHWATSPLYRRPSEQGEAFFVNYLAPLQAVTAAFWPLALARSLFRTMTPRNLFTEKEPWLGSAQ